MRMKRNDYRIVKHQSQRLKTKRKIKPSNFCNNIRGKDLDYELGI
jgi:hypothetical protein